MQPLNDHIDNLFRQAAEQYPLSNHGADFGKVLQQLDKGDVPPPPEKKRRRLLWLLLLLIPIPFVYEHHRSANNNIVKGSAEHLETVTKKAGTTPNNPQQTITTTPPDNNLTDNPLTSINNTAPSTATVQNTHQQTTNTASKDVKEQTAATTTSNKRQSNSQTSLHKQNYLASKASVKHTELAIYSSVIASKKRSGRNNQSNFIKDNLSGEKSDENALNKDGKKSVTTNQFTPNATTSLSTDSTSLADSISNTIARQSDTSKSFITQAQKAGDSTSNLANKKDKKTSPKSKSFLYAGAVAGTDISYVKSADTHGLGYNAGFVAGYRFGKHLAVESGIIWNYKKYYADGQYVSTEKLGLRNHTQVLNIDGSCGMIEIPLAVQYHFGNTGKTHWYAAAGVSSYLMKKEEYYYLSRYYNMQYYGEKEYKNSTKNWLSVLQLSAGYQLHVGKKNILRFEPYIKLPIAKIGIAQMPLSSAGINMGYIVPLK